ncbi:MULTISPECIES: TerD family protein [unclassified Pseudomonas]|uniref:TerD family protein n=1 Tax=unclassified Pseudomonas TaxID=196821 RepID=UPI001473A1A6|nr:MULTISPECIES: TerD family protein [unclassified Pseudomonas]NMX93344.1 TerD family protein [Pseudomonas sp. WS 5086]NMY46036.1 TerD family protein [Pseudomonas sp. WS 5027]
MNQALFLRRRSKVHVPMGTGGATHAQVASAVREIAAFRCVLSEPLIEQIGRLSATELKYWLREIIGVLRRETGAHVHHRPFYPDFPEQVLTASEAQLYLNAVIHYLTLWRLPPTEHHRPAMLEGNFMSRVIELGSISEFESLLEPLVSSRTSLSKEETADVLWFIREYKSDVFRLLPEAIPFRENRAQVGSALILHVASDTRVETFLERNVETAADVLRLAVALNGGDVSLATASTRFTAMKRSMRRLLLRLLDRIPSATEDVMRHAERWKRLAEVLHPGDYADKYPRALAAITAARRNEAPDSFGSRVETLLAQRHIATLIPILQSRPGEFARRLDVTLRRATEPESVLDAFEAVAQQVSSPVLLQLLGQISAPRPLPLRAFTPKGSFAKIYGIKDRREPLAPDVLARAARICEDALVTRFAALPPLGRCFIDPVLREYRVPLAQRSSSKSLRTLVRGSRLPMPDTRFIRLFLWWKNGRERTDIDLSAAFFDTNFEFKETVAYYNLKDFGGYHSGDIVDAPKGASEFIDLDLDVLVERGIRYVVTSINSFTEQPYCDLPECFAGWMARADTASGEIFEPRSVFDRIDIASNTGICLPFVMDLQERRMIWADLGLTSFPRWNNVQNNLSGVSLMLRALIHTPRPDLETLFDLHVRARGERVASPQQAQAVFAPDQGITPFDTDLIRSQFL